MDGSKRATRNTARGEERILRNYVGRWRFKQAAKQVSADHGALNMVERMGKQQEAMDVMAQQRRYLASLREEARRLKALDRADNIERMKRAKDWTNAELKEKQRMEDERECHVALATTRAGGERGGRGV